MSADLDTQHFGVPGEPGAPGTARIRRAQEALAAAERLQPTLQGQSATVMHRLMEALREHLPTYVVREVVDSGATWTETTTVAKDLPSYAAAQQWIADADPAARRVFSIEVQR